MDSVIFEGKEYMKASVLAERFRYTQDYLGQLCRGKKVDARLVGRAWYINLDSLEGHRTGRYKTVKVDEISPKKPINNYLSRIDVEPVLKNKTVKIFKEKNGNLTELPVRYEQDEYSLIPKINKAAVHTAIPVLPAEAERLKIKKEPKKFNITDFKAEALPEVFLSGSIKVDGIPEAIESNETDDTVSVEPDITSKTKPELINISSPKRLVSVRQPVKRLKRGTEVDMRPPANPVSVPKPSVPEQIPQKVIVRISRPSARKKSPSKTSVETFSAEPKSPTPTPLTPKQVKFTPDTVASQKVQNEERVGVSNFLFIVSIFLSATVVSFVLFSAEREMLVERGSYIDTLSFDLAKVTQFFSGFSR